MQVKATRLGYYEHKRRHPDVVFTLVNPKDFSEKWMEKLSVVVETKKSKGSKYVATQAEDYLDSSNLDVI